jgi:hypothetical protein
MKHFLPILFLLCLFFLAPGPAEATQGHGGIEGVYMHQLAHLFFVFSMGVLVYWLRERKLVAESGWRYIQYAAFFLILWNLDALLVHALDDQFNIIRVVRLEPWRIQILSKQGKSFVCLVYYLAKLDHLLCVPALVFLYLGLKRLLKKQPSRVEPEAQ